MPKANRHILRQFPGMSSCQKLRKQDSTQAADNCAQGLWWTLLNTTEPTVIFLGGVAQKNGASCVVITCKFAAYSITRASLSWMRKRQETLPRVLAKIFPKNENLSPREMEKASRNRKSLRSPVLNARALTCYFLTRSLNSWRHVLFNYPYLKYYLNKNLGVFGSD